jgi:hypothetical protein
MPKIHTGGKEVQFHLFLTSTLDAGESHLLAAILPIGTESVAPAVQDIRWDHIIYQT